MAGPRLAGRKALITGGGAGIGAATARCFLQEGAALALVDMDSEALQETQSVLLADFPGMKVDVYQADVSDAQLHIGSASDRCSMASGAWRQSDWRLECRYR